ncbi:hypothetical protein M422DRAFT_61900 [Sphaerobolus stellatus SS14]|uniref:methylmalonate-semialdehyde dehydrogenase (CoA acylating) n=1 Tax=Sphaerobolus stellatus (strain SS14) TaxID=990650 RepID=A0A0C9UIA9_SPHS4|nr:hypothetical protein M422DRAFT_61900 [Sphaerobolus stellatus SS14]
MMMAELCQRAGLPAGVVNVVHGSVPTVNAICDHPAIKAINFVGGYRAGKHIYERGTKNGKRVQANLSAKNHAVIIPDANKNLAINSLLGAAFGAAGQRCMAISVAVLVGTAQAWLPDIVEGHSALKTTSGFEQGAEFNFVGPTILEVTTDMKSYNEEIFGPVLCVINADTLDDALDIINTNKYGNATARKFDNQVNVGQIGINVSIPVPLPMSGWSGNKNGLKFYTQHKTTTTLWKGEDAIGNKASVDMPTMK